MTPRLTDHQKDAIRESIYLSSRWSLALFAAAAVLAGWLGPNFRVGNFDTLFWVGGVIDVGLFIGSLCLVQVARRSINKLRN